MTREEKVAKAGNPNTPREALAELAGDRDLYVRWVVARNPRTPQEDLAGLAQDQDWDIRESVVFNLNTPPEVLAKLVRYEYCEVRWNVARNPHTPPVVLTALGQGKVLAVSSSDKPLPRSTQIFLIKHFLTERPRFRGTDAKSLVETLENLAARRDFVAIASLNSYEFGFYCINSDG